MFDSWNSREFDSKFDRDDYFDIDKQFQRHKDHASDRMSTVLMWVGYAVAALVLLSVISCCCRRCRRRNQGVVLHPPSAVVVTAPAQPARYPQQQYVTAVVSGYPPPPPAANTQYMQHPPHPAPYPAAGGAPYPTAGGAPYPVAGAAPYPVAPSAPDHNVLPPTYEQAVRGAGGAGCGGGDEPYAKHPPYNPSAPR